MSDVFKLPMVCEEGDGYLYSKDLRHSIVFDDSDANMMEQKTSVAHAINNHDRMVEEIAELREFVCSLQLDVGNEIKLENLLAKLNQEREE
ncbi:coil containing protein [Vibrio phage 466E53-1]|nr:coil containing protein [Vibrio phage 466E53-1]